jgi:hypothetical protein
MKKLFVSLLAAMAIVGCDQDDTPVDVTGSVSFVVSGSGLGAGKIAGLTPEKVVVSVEDNDGKTIIDNKVFDLTVADGGYATEKVLLDEGEYKVTKYLVISGETAAYATPRSGAEKANLIDKPLPFGFAVVASEENSVTPKIIGISSQDSPQNFGYNDFGYSLPDADPQFDWMFVRVKLEMRLDGIFYENIDADFTVRGFDETDNAVWVQNFIYTGPETNDLKLKDGLHHYTIEARKWGKVLSQIYTRASLYEGRVREGVVPTTQVFQAEVEPKKVASYVTSLSKTINNVTTMVPANKVEHEYQDGRIHAIKNYTWNTDEKKFVDESHSEFFYEGKSLKKIVAYLAGQSQPYSEDNYTYDELGYATHIQHKGFGIGITTEVDLAHLYGDRVVKATYRNTNGTGFEYEFVNQYGNMKSDKTTRGSELCSEGTYTTDKNINPLKHLGYTDYLLRNYSIGNRLTESVNYVACAFPAAIPESYSYVYDVDGYPVRATTNYRGSSLKAEVDYTYMVE